MPIRLEIEHGIGRLIDERALALALIAPTHHHIPAKRVLEGTAGIERRAVCRPADRTEVAARHAGQIGLGQPFIVIGRKDIDGRDIIVTDRKLAAVRRKGDGESLLARRRVELRQQAAVLRIEANHPIIG